MKTEILFQAIAFFFVLLTFRTVYKNYSNLPEKIPMHIGPDGKADSWWLKNHGTAYILSYISLLIWVVLLFLSVVLFEKSKWHFAFNAVGIAFLLYYFQVGFIKYTLTKIKNMGLYILIGLMVFGLSFILAELMD